MESALFSDLYDRYSISGGVLAEIQNVPPEAPASTCVDQNLQPHMPNCSAIVQLKLPGASHIEALNPIALVAANMQRTSDQSHVKALGNDS